MVFECYLKYRDCFSSCSPNNIGLCENEKYIYIYNI
jgi:hypothetical protein